MEVDENYNRIGQDYIDVRNILQIKFTVLGYWFYMGFGKNLE